MADEGKSHDGHRVEHLGKWSTPDIRTSRGLSPPTPTSLAPSLPAVSDTWKPWMANAWPHSELSALEGRTRAPRCGGNSIHRLAPPPGSQQ